jgi:hypothetical protein
MTFRRTLVVALLAALLPIGSAAPSAAQCAPPTDLEEAVETAHVVFVGKVALVDGTRTQATVRVLSVWKGPDLDQLIEVSGGYEGGGNMRRFTNGGVYLFFPNNRRPPFVDDACTATRLYSGPQLTIPPYLADEAGSTSARMPLPLEEEPEGSSANSIFLPLTIGMFLVLTILGVVALYGRAVRFDGPSARNGGRVGAGSGRGKAGRRRGGSARRR